jgi:hypothetical protein
VTGFRREKSDSYVYQGNRMAAVKSQVFTSAHDSIAGNFVVVKRRMLLTVLVLIVQPYALLH